MFIVVVKALHQEGVLGSVVKALHDAGLLESTVKALLHERGD